MNFLWLYHFLHYILTPFLMGLVYFRLFKKKEHPLRFQERFGKPSIKRPSGQLFWFHGASNGECLSFFPLIERLQKTYPKAHFLVTSQTLTSAELVQSKAQKNVIHQFLPLDHPLFVKRFLDHWTPDMVFWTESELWPHIIHRASKKSPLVLLNGRLSDGTYKCWKMMPTFSKNLFMKFSLIFPQSSKDLEKFKNLGADHAQYVGNLKFSGPPLEIDPKELKSFAASFKDRPLWTASCTHSGEEEIVIKAHQLLKKSIPHILTIIVPRHPNRGDKLRQTWETQGLTVAQYVKKDPITSDTDIFLCDATGTLGLIYRLSPITFLGGSLIDGIGGHNPLEAALLKSALCVGPYTKNNQEMYDAFRTEGLCAMVRTSEEISETVFFLLKNKKEREALIAQSFSFAKNQQNVVDTLLKTLEKARILP